MLSNVFFVVCFAVFARAIPPPYPVYPEQYIGGQHHEYYPAYGYGHHNKDHYTYPKYKFGYAVNDPHTGDHKSHEEYRDGDVVKGKYTVADPDGTLRVVHYTADDKHGFNAVVEKHGESIHPQPIPYHPHKQYLPPPVLVQKVVPAVYEKPYYYGHHGY